MKLRASAQVVRAESTGSPAGLACRRNGGDAAGNFTLVGSVANLIVAQRAKARGVELTFGAYFKVGAPLTVLTIAFGLWLL